MQISPAGSKPGRRGRARDTGFTLVELMVVVTVIALASAAAMLAMPDPRGRLVDEAGRFAARARAARDLGIVEARPISLWVTATGYGFDRRQGGGWTPIADKPLRVERWGEGTAARLADRSGRERMVYDTTGGADRPLIVRLGRDDATATVSLGTDGSVVIDG